MRPVACIHGDWGERIAAEFLRRKGYTIVERNVRPDKHDRRLEIDIVAYDRANDVVIFAEVKQHCSHSPFERRLRGVDARKKSNLRRACRAWLRIHSWSGGYRFDVVEVFGTPGTRAECDHIERVELFPVRGKFVRWA